MQIQHDGYIIDTDRARLDLDVIHDFLANQSYWAQGRSQARVQTALDNSALLWRLHGGGRAGGLGARGDGSRDLRLDL